MLRVLLAVVAAALTYAAAEAVTTALWVSGVLEPRSQWVHARTNPTGNIRFDPIRGAFISSKPAPIACIATNGVLETTGVYRGNNHGFPDRDDFDPPRPDPETKRLAVFGDSYTHAQFIEMNWPDRVEDWAREDGRRLQLLNFALDGAGLANWASVLTRYVRPQGYELDGVAFAVWGDDLQRRFVWWSDRPRRDAGDPEPVLQGYDDDWHLDRLTPAEAYARALPQPHWWVASPEYLERAITGDRKLPFERRVRPFLWKRAGLLLDRLRGTGSFAPGAKRFSSGQRRLIGMIREALDEMGVPVLVVRIPNPIEYPSWRGEAERFARLLDARYLDGLEAFADAGAGGLDEMWLRFDPHWNQQGSDRFARFMLRELASWP